MPKFDLDKDTSLFSPLEFTIDGKVFIVGNVKHKDFDALSDMDNLAEQFALLAGIKKKEADDLSAVKMAKAVQLIIKAIVAPFAMDLVPKEEATKEKNVSKPGEKK